MKTAFSPATPTTEPDFPYLATSGEASEVYIITGRPTTHRHDGYRVGFSLTTCTESTLAVGSFTPLSPGGKITLTQE